MFDTTEVKKKTKTKKLAAKKLFMGMNTLSRLFGYFFLRETTFMISSWLKNKQKRFRKRIYPKRNEFAPQVQKCSF